MDSLLRRERQRLLDDLLDLQREEDLQKQYRTIFKSLDRSKYESDDEDEDRNHRNRRKRFCLIKLTYQKPNPRRQRDIDEITIHQRNQTVYKGCLQDGEQFTFKSKRSGNDSRLKLKFYINDVLEDEMIACCEYGLINRNQRNHFFQIDNILGAKPCEDCESDADDDNDIPKPIQSSLQRLTAKDSLGKMPISSEKQSHNKQKPKEKKLTLSIPESPKQRPSSEGFPVDIDEFSDYHATTLSRSKITDQSDDDSISSIPPPMPKPKHGPPQLSTMLSRTDSLDLSTPNIRESTSEKLFNSSAKTQEKTAALTNSNLANSISHTDKYLSRQSSIIETSYTDPERSISLANSSEIALANDATQIILTRLGIVPQPQNEQIETSKTTPPREKGNVEYFILIYLCQREPAVSVIKQLRSFVNLLKIYNDGDDCIAYINTIIHEKVILVLEDSYCESILPRIKELQQIYTIHVLGKAQDRNDSASKIQGFYDDIQDVYEPISNDINKISRDLIIYLNTSTHAMTLEPVVSYFLLLSEIILDKTEIKSDIKDLSAYARQEYAGNEEELKIIDEFESTYEKTQAVYWYSRSCFISKMLNKALRLPTADILFRFRLFIQDLFYQIENESISETTTIYLGQTIQRNDLDELQTNIKDTDIIIFPQFLFGTTDQSRAIRIAKEIPPLNNDVIPLIIQVEIPGDFRCANLNSRGYAGNEDNNILLNMGTMGNLIKIEKDSIKDDRVASIHVKLTKLTDERNLEQILERTRTEIKSFSPLVTLVKLMMQMNQHTSAEQLIQTLFEDENLKSDTNLQGSIAAACHILAQFQRDQNDYKRALDLYLISLETFQRIISPNAVELSSLYSNIGSMYFRLETYDKSHEFYQKALEINLRSNTPDFYSISSFTNSIGIIYSKQGKYPEAIKSFERTLKILQQSPEQHDAELAATYDDLGDAYFVQLKFDEALNNYSKALEIQERIVPRNVQTLASSYHTVGNIYLKFGRSKEALHHLKRALECFQEILPETHSTLALLHNNIGLMYFREEQYDEALKCYSKSLEIAGISLPDNHTLVGITLFNMGLVYSSQEKFEEAIETIEKSTKQFLKTLAPDHADIEENNKYIESIRQKQTLKNIFQETTISF